MNPLLNAQHCILYHLDSTFITKARFNQPTPGSITLIFSEKPDFRIPEQFYLMPDETKHDFISYQCTKFGSLSDFYVETTERTYYTLEVITNDTPKLREELRVNVSIQVDAIFDDSPEPEPITIKNISAGGLMFISKKKVKKHSLFAFAFTPVLGKPPISATARIIGMRPTYLPDTFSYNCQFTGLLSKDETAIRNFVFTEDLAQKRRAEE